MQRGQSGVLPHAQRQVVSKLPTVARVTKNGKEEDPLAQQFRTLRNEVFAILGRLVEADLLSPRQLCNSAWAVGKHHAYDDSILPGHGAGIELGMRERWNIGDDVDNGSSGDGSNDPGKENDRKLQEELAQTMDEIALRLTSVLDRQEEEEEGGGGESEDNVVKVGELTMACWAYASTRPREVPPGWELPPRVGRVPDDAGASDSGSNNSDVATALVSAAAIGGAPGNDISGGADAVKARADSIFDGPMDDVVIFERLDEIDTSTVSHREQKRAQSRSDIIVDDLFDAVSNVLCKERRPHVNGSDGK